MATNTKKMCAGFDSKRLSAFGGAEALRGKGFEGTDVATCQMLRQ